MARLNFLLMRSRLSFCFRRLEWCRSNGLGNNLWLINTLIWFDMTLFSRKNMLVLIGISLAIAGIREAGVININNNLRIQTQIVSVVSVTSKASERSLLTNSDIEIPVSFLDYVPLHKSRNIKVEVEKKRPDGSSVSISYDLDITVTGICTGSTFRRIAQKRMLEHANIRAL
jgi:hypothetical protein